MIASEDVHRRVAAFGARSRTSRAVATGSGRIDTVLVVHATCVLRDHLTHSPAHEHDTSTTTLGAWYATRLRGRRPAALLVNHTRLLPLFVPLAPATTLLARSPKPSPSSSTTTTSPLAVLTAERRAMNQVRVAPTADRSTVGVLNGFARLADCHRADTENLLELSLLLARTPLGPLYRRHVSPDRELARPDQPAPARSARAPPTHSATQATDAA